MLAQNYYKWRAIAEHFEELENKRGYHKKCWKEWVAANFEMVWTCSGQGWEQMAQWNNSLVTGRKKKTTRMEGSNVGK